MSNIKMSINENSCTGCGACAAICPTRAIELKKNSMRYRVACVDKSKCINCGMCVKFCHAITPIDRNYPMRAWAGYQIDENRREEYSSGGAASVIAKKFIEKRGGRVCGCAWNEKGKNAEHFLVDDILMLERFRGSKYVESDISETYSEIKETLKNGIPCLFIGTPCQCAAIKHSFKSDILYTIDLICHGVPADTYLTEYIEHSSFARSAKNVYFRGKHDFCMTFTNNHGDIVYKVPKNCDLYFSAFLSGVDYRENCYYCPYANQKRVGDLTLGDFWGLDHSTLKKPYGGRISLLLENTSKGGELLDLISQDFYLEERALEEAIKENKQLTAPMPITDDHLKFIKNYPTYGFKRSLKSTSVYKSVKSAKKNYRVVRFKQKIKTLLLGGNK